LNWQFWSNNTPIAAQSERRNFFAISVDMRFGGYNFDGFENGKDSLNGAGWKWLSRIMRLWRYFELHLMKLNPCTFEL
jgi:hypothetical protein